MTAFAGQKARRKRAVFPYIRERYRQPADFFKNLPVFFEPEGGIRSLYSRHVRKKIKEVAAWRQMHS